MLDAFRELIDELLSGPATLRAMNIGSTANADAIAAVAVLTERDFALVSRVQSTIRKDVPLLKAPPDQPSTESLTGSSEDILARYESGRGEVISLLMNLTLKDWERTAIDWHGQEISVAGDVESHVEFDETTVERLRKLMGDSVF